MAPGEIQSYFQKLAFEDASLDYLDFHLRRYSYLLERLELLAKSMPADRLKTLRILDVGMSFQTALLHNVFPQAAIETLGFYDKRYSFDGLGPHHHFDLNEADEVEKWPKAAQGFDLIVMAEVIEHLYRAPVHALRLLRSLMRPKGYLVVQTPNAISLGRRMQVLRGRNPYEMIRDSKDNPGHFCEYTVADLRAIGRDADLALEQGWIANYFGRVKPVYETLTRVLPGELGDGITAIFTRLSETH